MPTSHAVSLSIKVQHLLENWWDANHENVLNTHWLFYMRGRTMILAFSGEKNTTIPQRSWSDLKCVYVFVQSGSVEQSWAQQSISSSIIHQNQTNDIDWAGCGKDTEHSLSDSSFSLQTMQFPFKNNLLVALKKEQNRTVPGVRLRQHKEGRLRKSDRNENCPSQRKHCRAWKWIQPEDTVWGTDMWVKVDQHPICGNGWENSTVHVFATLLSSNTHARP